MGINIDFKVKTSPEFLALDPIEELLGANSLTTRHPAVLNEEQWVENFAILPSVSAVVRHIGSQLS